ncbi:histidine kinase [Aeromonas hydrophila]|nr:histidine kinase [Aeromonas hydrophila]
MGILKRGWSKLWPKGLTGQIILVALAGLVLIQLLSIQIYRTDREEALGYINSRNAMQRIVSVVRLLALSPPPSMTRSSRRAAARPCCCASPTSRCNRTTAAPASSSWCAPGWATPRP